MFKTYRSYFIMGLTVIMLLSVPKGDIFGQAANKVSGQVTNAEGKPLAGVTIMIEGTSRGTTTDKNGRYEITYDSDDAVLVFSFVGFATEQVNIDGRQTIDITLIEDVVGMQDLVVVGSRSRTRSVTDSPVPVDIIPVTSLVQSKGQMDMNQLLQYAAPSFNANRQSGADGSDHIDPATLRGLGPDQTLVLINGKRRHQSSLINIFGTRGRGNNGTDLNAIPPSAIERIEILRDGASAQYGSDAIAGVINIVLKSSVNRLNGSVSSGVRSEGDGEMVQMSGNYGFNVGSNGFVNMTLEYLNKGRTNRPADPEEFDIYRRQFGDSESENFSAFFNSEIPIKGDTRFYAFGGFNYRDTDAYAWTREPNSNRNVPAIYPNGFDPHILSQINDKSLSAGIKGKLSEWNVDYNNTIGVNRFHYFVNGSLNASLLERSPTRFDAGGFQLLQNTTGVTLSRFFDNSLEGINLAFGAEYRIENYQIFAGEEASWKNFGVIDTVIDGKVEQFDKLGRPGGSQGFPGFRPENELNENRSNFGVFLDTEFDFTSSFMMGAAVRFENYSDFGSTFNGKLATRLALSEALALRGSVSSGFRAPSLAQIYFNSTFTDFVSGQPVDKVIAENNGIITRELGIPELKQETALNASLGFTVGTGGFQATVDGYFVDIADRIVLTGAFEDTDPDIGQELRDLNVGAAQFFTNAVDTRTLGLDVILSYAKNIGIGQRLKASIAANFNDMEIEDIATNEKLAGKEDIYFGPREQKFLLASAPPSKINLNLNYLVNNFDFDVQFIRFGEVVLIDWLGTEDVYKPKVTTDVTVGYDITSNISLSVGGANIFDVYPTQQDTETETGGLWDAVQMGYNGAFFFTRVHVNL